MTERLLGIVLLGPVSLAAPAAVAAAPARISDVAPAAVSVVWRGHAIHQIKVNQLVSLVVRFTMPHSFPSGYSDVRFLVAEHGRTVRTLIYGTPRHLHPGQTLQVSLPQPMSHYWLGTWRITGVVTLLRQPGGASLGYRGQGATVITVKR